MSDEEESFYIKKLLEGDRESRNKLIEHNLRLVAHIVKKYENINTSSDDLISIGTIGLIKGIDSYSLDCGVKLNFERSTLNHLENREMKLVNVKMYNCKSYTFFVNFTKLC